MTAGWCIITSSSYEERGTYLAEPIVMYLVCVHQCIHAKSATMKRRKASRKQGDMQDVEKRTHRDRAEGREGEGGRERERERERDVDTL
jgi:hypothetical protein